MDTRGASQQSRFIKSTTLDFLTLEEPNSYKKTLFALFVIYGFVGSSIEWEINAWQTRSGSKESEHDDAELEVRDSDSIRH